MSEKFSPTLRLGDLNDFIAPSQACVISLKGSKPIEKKPDRPQVPNLHAFLSFLFVASPSNHFLMKLLASFDLKPISSRHASSAKTILLFCDFVFQGCDYPKTADGTGQNLSQGLLGLQVSSLLLLLSHSRLH